MNTPLLPSLREKIRYLAFEVISKRKIRDFSSASRAIGNACLRFLGELEGGKAGINILPEKYNSEKQTGLIRVQNKYTDHLKAALMFVKEIDGEEVIVRSTGVSGILKKAQTKYLS